MPEHFTQSSSEMIEKQHRSAPTLETERLLIRGYRKGDLAEQFALVGDDATMLHIGGKGLGLEETWRRMAASVGMWPLVGFGGWAVTRKADGKIIGTVSLFNGWRDMVPEFGDEPEMGWIFSPEVHGQGMASEACKAILSWADANLPSIPIWAIIDPGNEPSRKLAARLGFEDHSIANYHDEMIIVLQRPTKA